MKIAVDCSLLTQTSRTGTHNFLYYLLKELALIDTNNEYHLCFKYEISPEFKADISNGNPNFSFHYLKKAASWTQVSFSYFCMSRAFDVIFSPWHTVPIIKNSRVKIVAVIHDLYIPTFNIMPSLYTCIVAHRLIAVSDFTKDEIIKKFKVDPLKIKRIYEGVDTSTFYPRNATEIAEIKTKYKLDKPYVLYVGTLGQRKNLFNQLKAFAQQKRDCLLVLGGNASPDLPKSQLEKMIQELGLQNNVLLLGRIPQDDLPALLSGALAFTFVSCVEGFGLPALEAQACGVPVLSSNGSSLKEVLGDSAVLVDPDSVSAISEGMTKITLDASLRAQLVEKGLANCKRFDWKTTAVQTLEVFNSLSTNA